MELTHDFRVGVPPSEAWKVLTDVEQIAPCMPGAELHEVQGGEYRGIVKVKVGPITTQYKGTARFLEQDEGAGHVVLRAEGRDTRGQGNANATITADLTPDGDGTKVSVVTDLTVTGKVAQFGRGVLADVSAKLLGQFVDCLEADILAGSSAPADTPEKPAWGVDSNPSDSAVRTLDGPGATPVDLLDAAGGPVAKRAVPALVGALFFLLLVFRWRRRRKR